MKMQMELRETRQEGITLIALVVTIIVLLILAGVTINLTVGQNGIITRANEAKEATRIASIEERANLWKLDVETAKLAGKEPTQGMDEILAQLESEGLLTSDEVASIKEDANNSITIGSKTISFKVEEIPTGPVLPEEIIKNPAYIGKGLTYKEGTIADGYVVTDGSNNEFVWIPVTTPVAENEQQLSALIAVGRYPMAVKTTVTDGVQNYRGVLYDFGYDIENNKVTVTARNYSADSGYREPAYLTSNTDGDASKYNPFTVEEFSEATLQREFNTMVEKVKTNGGFYIGRYETSYNGTVVESKANKVSMTAEDNSQMWYGMYDKQKGLTNGNIISSMIWGSQYDQVMLWMKEVPNPNASSKPFYILDSTSMGNYYNVAVYDSEGANIIKVVGTGAKLNTGVTTFTKVKNVYDLAGNVNEWTMETYDTDSRVQRGGDYDCFTASDAPASYRIGGSPSYPDGDLGSRLVLY